MNAYQLGKVAGIINRDVETLTPACLGNLSTAQSCYPVILRHVWARAQRLPEIQALMDQPGELTTPGNIRDQGSFWLGCNSVR